ncbi:hypothetical protein [Maricaulis parjimensis]|uniref:hypothetical protein n=1 Tax=Maricaulis parjimensis TaxID=144023 RepID=UPI00193AC6F3|nr:hypothetical protein [Maricaulis parjimensis]
MNPYARFLEIALKTLLGLQFLFGIFVLTSLILDTLDPQNTMLGLPTAQALQLEPDWLRFAIAGREASIAVTVGLVFLTGYRMAPLVSFGIAFVLRVAMWFEFTGNPIYEGFSPDWIFFLVDALVLSLLLRRWLLDQKLVS